MMLRDMGMGTLALKGAGRLGLGADGVAGGCRRIWMITCVLTGWKTLPMNGKKDDCASLHEARRTSHQGTVEIVSVGWQAPPPEVPWGRDGCGHGAPTRASLGVKPDGTSYTYEEWRANTAILRLVPGLGKKSG